VVSSSPFTLLSQLESENRLAWLDNHRIELETELCAVGSHTFGRQRLYAEVVRDLAGKIGASYSPNDPTTSVEEKIVKKICEDAWAKLTPEQRVEFRAKVEQLAAKQGKSAKGALVGFGALATAQLSGFGVYVLASSLLGAISGTLGLGLGFGVFTGLSSLISVVIGPFGWIGLGVVAVRKLGAPNYKKLLPAVIAVYTERNQPPQDSSWLTTVPAPELPPGQLEPSGPPQTGTEGQDLQTGGRHPESGEPDFDVIAREYGCRSYRELSEKDKDLVQKIHAERLEAQRPVLQKTGSTPPVPTKSPEAQNAPQKRQKPPVIILRKGDAASRIPEKKVETLRKHYHRIWLRLEFTSEAVDRLVRRYEHDLGHFEPQFGRINLGIGEAKHHVPGTDPKVWELEARNDRIYFRQIAQETYLIELVGSKSSQDSDYRFLRKVKVA
jgi:uncharacterized protein YaaW (UPF0174 family)